MKRLVIGICGGTGSGKTTITERIISALSPESVLVLQQDHYYKDFPHLPLDERAKQFLTGEAEAVGLPELRPDRNVLLDKLGGPFSKTYYIQEATHKIDGNGYRTRFKVKETGL